MKVLWLYTTTNSVRACEALCDVALLFPFGWGEGGGTLVARVVGWWEGGVARIGQWDRGGEKGRDLWPTFWVCSLGERGRPRPPKRVFSPTPIFCPTPFSHCTEIDTHYRRTAGGGRVLFFPVSIRGGHYSPHLLPRKRM